MRLYTTMSVAALLAAAWPAGAWDPREVMREANLQNSPRHERSDFTMVLVDADGNRTARTGTQYFRRKAPDGPESSRLFRFHSPPEMARSGVLLVENAEKDNEQWIYLPATYATRRIPSRNRGDRYMGTDFSYEDAVSFRIGDYRYAAMGDELVDGSTCHKIEQVPTAERLIKESLYSRIVEWVDAERGVVLQAEYFDKAGGLLKRYRASRIERVGDAYRASHMEMEDLRLRHRTIVDITGRDAVGDLRESYFTVRSLERPE